MTLHRSPLRSTALRMLAFFTVAGVGLTGCSSNVAAEDPQAETTATASSQALPEAEGQTSYPLTLSSPWGETVLEERPERIAVLGGAGDGEVALALGATLVTSPWETADHWDWLEPYAAQLENAEFTDPWGDTLPLEKLASAEPDVILAHSSTNLADQYDELSAIAPVLAPETEEKVTWQETTLAVGETLDLKNAAQDLVDGISDEIETRAAEHPEYKGKTVAILVNRGTDSGVQLVNTKGSYAEQILSELGFAPHPHVDEISAFQKGILSTENLGLIDADVIIVAQHGGKGSSEEAKQWLENNGLYAALPAVQEGRVSEILPDPNTGTLDIAWAFSWPNVLSINYILDTFDDALSVI